MLQDCYRLFIDQTLYNNQYKEARTFNSVIKLLMLLRTF